MSVPQMLSFSMRPRFSVLRAMMARVTVMAVNIDARIPTESVTAKPLTGPEPNWNSTMAAISVVILASTMVENALA